MNAPTKTDVLRLYNLTLQEAELGVLPGDQSTRFAQACQRIINENSTDDFHEQIIAARVYLRYIRCYPDLELPC
jgi:hypothetical protein